MTKVTLATPDGRKSVIKPDETIIKAILDENSVNYTHASVMLDGTPLSPDKLRQSIAELGATGDCTLSVCVKMDNAI